MYSFSVCYVLNMFGALCCHQTALPSFNHTGSVFVLTASPHRWRTDCHLLWVTHWLGICHSYNPTSTDQSYRFKCAYQTLLNQIGTPWWQDILPLNKKLGCQHTETEKIHSKPNIFSNLKITYNIYVETDISVIGQYQALISLFVNTEITYNLSFFNEG